MIGRTAGAIAIARPEAVLRRRTSLNGSSVAMSTTLIARLRELPERLRSVVAHRATVVTLTGTEMELVANE